MLDTRSNSEDLALSSPMIGIIPAAGSGIRARPYTYEQHKGMFAIDGEPNLERLMTIMRDSMGIEEIVIVVGYMADTIQERFGDGSATGVKITYVQNNHLDKGWAWSVLLAKPFLAGRHACIMLADEFYLDSNHDQLAEFDYLSYSAVCTVKSVADPELIRRNFSVEKDDTRVIRLVENPVSLPNDLLGMATFIVSPDVLTELEAAYDRGRPSIDFVNFIDELIRDGHSVAAFELDAGYVNLNDVASLEAAQDMAIRRRLSQE
jgi:NDP-sugar pyrophosphorylase family protein